MSVAQTNKLLYPIFSLASRSDSKLRGGFINNQGEVVVDPVFDSVDWFFDDRAAVCVDGYWGFIDPNGTSTLEPQFAAQSRYYAGLAVCLADPNKRLWQVLDTSGGQRASIESYLMGNFFEGFAWIRSREERSGFIDSRGDPCTSLVFGPVGDFNHGVAPISVDGRWGFVDRSFNVVVDLKYDYAISTGTSSFVGIVRVGQNFGMIDLLGRWIVQPKFRQAAPFREGVSTCELPDGRCVLVGEDGDIGVVLEQEICGLTQFSEELCAASRRDGCDGFIDKSGRWVVAPRFQLAGMFRGGRALVYGEDGYGYIDQNGSSVWWSREPIDLPFHTLTSHLR